MTPVVRNILIACVAVFVLQQVTNLDAFALWPIDDFFSVPSRFEIWQLVTYAFMHHPTDFMHIFFNMFALYMFGQDIERLVGSKRFAAYYLVCIVSAALAQLIVQHIEGGIPVATVGASGGVFGLLLAYGLAFPRRKLMLIFPPIPMPAWLFVTLYGLIELYLGVSGRQANVAHFAHLGGMVGGLAMILYWRHSRASRNRY